MNANAMMLVWWNLYVQSLRKHPLTTKALTSAVLAGTADVTCQRIERSSLLLSHRPRSDVETNSENGRGRVTSSTGELPGTELATSSVAPAARHHHVGNDWNRTLQVCMVGLLWSGPAAHSWYNILERMTGRMQHGARGLAARMLLDAAVFSPIAVAGYFTCRGLLEGGGIQGVTNKLRDKWQAALLSSWQFWPLANIVNFTLVPLQFRVLYVSSLSFLWQGYLTHTNEEQ